jgi:hypothetical protein
MVLLNVSCFHGRNSSAVASFLEEIVNSTLFHSGTLARHFSVSCSSGEKCSQKMPGSMWNTQVFGPAIISEKVFGSRQQRQRLGGNANCPRSQSRPVRRDARQTKRCSLLECTHIRTHTISQPASRQKGHPDAMITILFHVQFSHKTATILLPHS